MAAGVAREAPLTNPAAERRVVWRGIAAVGLVSLALIHLLDVPGKCDELRRGALRRAHHHDPVSGRGDDPNPITCACGLFRARIAALVCFINVGGQDASIRS